MTQVIIDIRELANGNLSKKVQVRVSATATAAETSAADKLRDILAKALVNWNGELISAIAFVAKK